MAHRTDRHARTLHVSVALVFSEQKINAYGHSSIAAPDSDQFWGLAYSTTDTPVRATIAQDFTGANLIMTDR